MTFLTGICFVIVLGDCEKLLPSTREITWSKMGWVVSVRPRDLPSTPVASPCLLQLLGMPRLGAHLVLLGMQPVAGGSTLSSW